MLENYNLITKQLLLHIWLFVRTTHWFLFPNINDTILRLGIVHASVKETHHVSGFLQRTPTIMPKESGFLEKGFRQNKQLLIWKFTQRWRNGPIGQYLFFLSSKTAGSRLTLYYSAGYFDSNHNSVPLQSSTVKLLKSQ